MIEMIKVEKASALDQFNHRLKAVQQPLLHSNVKVLQLLMEEEGHKRLAENEAFITQLGAGCYDDDLESLAEECTENIQTIQECYVSMLERERRLVGHTAEEKAYVLETIVKLGGRIRSDDQRLSAIEARLAWLGR
jgi:hypothetical protein